MTDTSLRSGPRQASWKQRVRHGMHLTGALPAAGAARLLTKTRHAPRFCGVYADRAGADRAMASIGAKGYDDADISDVSFDVMCQCAPWDYPIVYWLSRLLPEHPAVLDAGGHLGTKYIAFSGLLDLDRVAWTVFDLPGIVDAARAKQARAELPRPLSFESRPEALPQVDILLASGLLQYLHTPFATFVDALPWRPRYILLNKVALREGPGIYTLERIGTNRVAYQIRNRANWEDEIARMGYFISDSWRIPELGHTIPTHPWSGRSESRGYILRRTDT